MRSFDEGPTDRRAARCDIYFRSSKDAEVTPVDDTHDIFVDEEVLRKLLEGFFRKGEAADARLAGAVWPLQRPACQAVSESEHNSSRCSELTR